MEAFSFSPEEFKTFLLVLSRVSIVVFLFPTFGSPMILDNIKVAIAFILTLAIIPIVKVDLNYFPKNSFEVVILIFSELCIGLAMGLTVRFYFASVQLAAQLISFQMGYTMINVLDPQIEDQVSILEQIGFWITMLVFLLLNGHHIFLTTVIESFKIINIGSITLHKSLLVQLLSMAKDMFVLSIKIGSPPIAALLFTSVAFGLCAKFEPKMNIEIVGMPLKIIIGLIFFGIMLQIVLIFTKAYVSHFHSVLFQLIRIIKP